MAEPEPEYFRLQEAIERLAVPLRMGQGIDELALAEVRDSLKSCADVWRSNRSVPPGTAALLVELYPALEGTSDLYDAEYAERVRGVALELLDAILKALANAQR